MTDVKGVSVQVFLPPTVCKPKGKDGEDCWVSPEKAVKVIKGVKGQTTSKHGATDTQLMDTYCPTNKCEIPLRQDNKTTSINLNTDYSLLDTGVGRKQKGRNDGVVTSKELRAAAKQVLNKTASAARTPKAINLLDVNIRALELKLSRFKDDYKKPVKTAFEHVRKRDATCAGKISFEVTGIGTPASPGTISISVSENTTGSKELETRVSGLIKRYMGNPKVVGNLNSNVFILFK